MPPIKTVDLLAQLSNLEATLNSFSFEQLSVDEANELKETFRVFKQNLENKIWGTATTSQTEITKGFTREIEIIDSSIKTSLHQQTIDLAPVLEDCMGELGLLQELVLLYKQNALEFIGQARLALDNKDFEQLRFCSHKVKNGLKMMHTKALLEIVESMQNVSQTTKDIAYLRFLYECFVVEYPSIENAIDRELEALTKTKRS
ncbi:Hpt domain-containing protein [Costertonia aggregata]|uniref:Hpt domain-containing protein n=1 Tax=Costertonia aggregata TaxID=343403 RepID=A0A7H9AUE5_9FLAO|nr:Hpt domain-containing protein [Costertonia aggregata]QLG47017.1 Hpt domain-containing protein [Costertonia aggregata]